MASPVESAVAFAGLGRAFTALLVPLLLLTSCPGASAGTTNPVMYTEPYLLSPTQTSMYVCWLTAEPTTQSYVEYGADESYGKTQAAVTYEIHGFLKKDASGSYTVPFPVYQQIAHVTGLEAGQKTFYRAVSELAGGTQKGPGYYFHTAPKPGTPIKFVLLSDMQGKKQIVDTVRFAGQQNADAIIYNGDLWSGPNYEAGESFSYPGAPLPVGADYASELHRWFNCLQQTSDGAKLLQYIPIYPCPGNHEIDEQYRMQKKDQADPNKMNMSLYCQLFRPLYPEQQYGRNGKHWYSRDFGSLHIVSLSIQRSYSWGASEAPGWPLFDDVKAGSPQQKWLADDLRNSTYGHYTWVTQHWHVFNRRDDVATPFTEPVVDPATQAVTYPGPDYLQRDILPLFTQYGVNGVSFGHSHVYERY
ncbi:MAG TPA: metallophosphoesterase family protein, partial [Armatimonadota bacterium]